MTKELIDQEFNYENTECEQHDHTQESSITDAILITGVVATAIIAAPMMWPFLPYVAVGAATIAPHVCHGEHGPGIGCSFGLCGECAVDIH